MQWTFMVWCVDSCVGLMCGLICRFDVVILCQWFAADVWNVNYYNLIDMLNSYVVILCSSDDIELLLWQIDCTPCDQIKIWHVDEPVHDTRSSQDSTCGLLKFDTWKEVMKPRGWIKIRNVDEQHRDTWPNKKQPCGPIKYDTWSNEEVTRDLTVTRHVCQ